MIPNATKKAILDAFLASVTLKVMLLDSNHVNNPDTQEFIDDVSANEVSGTGYTAGGATIANKAITQDNTDDEGVFDADDVNWPNSTITARYAAVYISTGTPGTSRILNIIDFGENKSSVNGDFPLVWASEGILNLN